MTKQSPNLMQMSQLKEADLHHFGHVGLHGQTAVSKIHAKVVD